MTSEAGHTITFVLDRNSLADHRNGGERVG